MIILIKIYWDWQYVINADPGWDSMIMSIPPIISLPNSVCLWPESPQEIDLYKMSSRYTKRPDSKEMYKDIGLSQYYEEGEHLKGDEDEADYNEAVQS